MFTETQKSQIRLVLGFADAFRYKNTRLESILERTSDQATVQVAALLDKITEIDTVLLEVGTTGAGVKRVDEIWFFGSFERIAVVKKTGRQYIARISIILGVPIYGDYYGGTGWPGDSYSGLGGPRYGGGPSYGLG